MHARIATFSVDDPAKIDGEIETTRTYTAGGRLPEGIPASGFLMLVDRDGGTVVEVLLFDSEEDLRTGDATMDSMAPGEGSMHRVSVKRFEVAVRLP
ncbi:MAG TPA: hypothetical protein VH305_02240 [Gaiella sp.]|jgi:hypothetical protein